MKTALLLIATGERYWKYIDPLLASARTYFVPHTPILWSDRTNYYQLPTFSKKNEGYPDTTLRRYHTFLEQSRTLACYDFLFWCDIDMLFVSPIKEEDIFADGLVATLHPGYIGKTGTPERRLESTAFLPPDAQNKYFCGGFNGGTTESFLTMAERISEDINMDKSRGVTAVWHDESHLNRYLHYNPPARILGPEYCYPEGCNGQYAGARIDEPKIIALTKT